MKPCDVGASMTDQPDSPFVVGTAMSYLAGDYAKRARLIEDLGFDYIASGEHVFHNESIPNGFILLSHIAAVTQSVRLLTAVSLVPLYPAPLFAKLASMTDVVSTGRLEIGIGIGGEYPAEFQACDVPMEERSPRTDETIDILKALWSGESTTFHGRFWSLDDVRLQPAPIQQPAPPIWVGGRKRAAIERTLRSGDVWMPYLCTPDQVRLGTEMLRNEAERFGRDPGALSTSVNCILTVDPNRDRARKTASEVASRRFRQDFSGELGRYLVVGNPSDCLTQLRDFHSAGAESVIFTLACPDDIWDDMIQLVAESMLPQMKAFGRETAGTNSRWRHRD